MRASHVEATAAEAIVEQLRFGVPPADRTREFTVGRDDQLRLLEESLNTPRETGGSALLVRANYGAGKTHLLKLIREMSLDAGYAVSLVEVNSQEGVRFNRLDTVVGAIARQIEVPRSIERGVAALLDAFTNAQPRSLDKEAKLLRSKISSDAKWDYSEFLGSPAIYVALRAWVHGDDERRRLIVDWLTNPTNYRGQRRLLYNQLVATLRAKFRDPRAEWQFYSEDVFMFHTLGHRQAWDATADYDKIARASGLKGLVLLFDEFEDVIRNLNRRDYQEQAFLNLFRFFAGDRFPGMAYFAVTPDFVQKCKDELLKRGVYDFDYGRFDDLKCFELDLISEDDFLPLAKHIREVHGLAYDWDAEAALGDSELRAVVHKLWAIQSPERVRRTTKGIVDQLDARLEA